MSEKPELSYDEYNRRLRRSLLFGGAATFGGYRGWRWIQDQPEIDRIPQVLRDGHELNESIWSSLFRDDHQARTFSRDSASVLRVNGRRGIRDELDLDAWRLQVFGPDGAPLGEHTLDDITALPHHEMTVEHKCIEGWARSNPGLQINLVTSQTLAQYVSAEPPERLRQLSQRHTANWAEEFVGELKFLSDEMP